MNNMHPPGVLSVGTDLVDIERIEKLFQKSKDQFLNFVFTPEERLYCLQKRNPAIHLAARFAAKEAIAKALDSGIGQYFSWKSASVAHSPSGSPIAILDERAQHLLQSIGGSKILLSLSHTKTIAHAIALVV